jgi:biopolymer transport protein ExbD
VTSVTTPAITLDLPKASASTRVLLVLGIELAENGNLMVDGKAVADEAELLELAKRAHSEHPDVRAVIRADTRVAHGRVIAVLDAVKRAGIAKIAFAVAPRAVP